MTKASKLVDRSGNTFEFVSMAAARARQLAEGCVPRVEGSAKLARRAVQEVEAGTVERLERPEPEDS